MKTATLILALAGLSAGGAAQAAPDAEAGKRLFGQCVACHHTEPSQPDMIGPGLAGIYRSKAAARRPKFSYSAALKASGLTWDDATLDKWLAEPAKLVPGTSMVFPGIAQKPARDNLIAYLKTLPK